jgi:hypothetical protein
MAKSRPREIVALIGAAAAGEKLAILANLTIASRPIILRREKAPSK